jgi:ribosome biogenesis GTPase
VSALSGEGVSDVAAYFSNYATCGLIGPSGAGKSTLANALLGADLMATAEVRTGDLRGRHTTTARHLLQLPGGGALVDTPGMREFGLTGETEAIDMVFSDISGTASNCRFRDCRHEDEPGCAVVQAIDAGEIENDRLASYRKLEKEQEAWRARNDPIARKQREQRWKSISRSTRQRKKFGGKWS